MKIQTTAEIRRDLRAQGIEPTRDMVLAEQRSQEAEATLGRYAEIVAAAELLDPADRSLRARQLRECAESARDHLAAAECRARYGL